MYPLYLSSLSYRHFRQYISRFSEDNFTKNSNFGKPLRRLKLCLMGFIYSQLQLLINGLTKDKVKVTGILIIELYNYF